MVTYPYNTTDFAFTLEDVFINFATETPDTYFDLKITITYYDFFSEIAKEKVLDYKIPLLNQAQRYNVGRKIHRYLANLSSYTGVFGFMYKTAKVTFLATEYTIADNTEVSTSTLIDVKFIAGEKPKLLENNIALLSNNTNYERITEKGLFIVNFLLPSGIHILKVYKNGSEVASETINASDTNHVFSKKIIAENFNAKKGDVFKLQIVGSSIAKSFVIFPNNISSKILIFIDTFKLFRVLECTGHYSFPDEYTQITHQYKRNLVEVLEIVDTEEINKFNINTGWVLKTDTETIASISKIKKVFLISDDVQVLDMVPIAKKLTKEDSENELYEYDLIFQINKSNA